MNRGRILVLTVVAMVLLWGSGFYRTTLKAQDASVPTTAQSNDGSAQNPTSTSAKKHNKEKQKRWSGSLVDVNCMAKAMSASKDQGARPPDSSVPRTQWLDGGAQYPGQSPGQSSPSPQTGPGQPTQPTMPMPGNPDRSPDTSQAQAAQMARAAMIDKEAKQCAATAATTAFGLVVSGGEVMKFDEQGNARANDALKSVSATTPGKALKAKVTGMVEGDGATVKVVSVEVKGKRPSPSRT
jgi:hypothetical protein